MSRTDAQKRYTRKRLKQIPVPKVVREEWEFLRAMKNRKPYSWLQVLYRGLGLRREDYLNSRKFDSSVP